MAAIKHHYLPVFYLKRWTGRDGQLTEFRKIYNTVKSRRVFPRATGYEKNLYSTDGVPIELAQAFEEKFLSPLDSNAAEALASLHNKIELTEPRRSAWAQFICSLLCRMPADILALKAAISEFFSIVLPEFQGAVELFAAQGVAVSFDELAEKLGSHQGSFGMMMAEHMMSHEIFMRGILGWHWNTIHATHTKFPLMVSDRPVAAQFNGDDAHLALPIGPSTLFVAAKSEAFLGIIMKSDCDEMFKAANAAVVGGAQSLVLGTAESQLRFVQNRIGTLRPQTVVEAFVEQQRASFELLRSSIRYGLNVAKLRLLEKT